MADELKITVIIEHDQCSLGNDDGYNDVDEDEDDDDDVMVTTTTTMTRKMM